MGHHRLAALASLVATALAATAARAEWTAGVDLGASLPIGEPETHPGWLAGGRAGYRFHLSSVSLGPEVGGGYGVYTPVASARKATGYFYGGARLGLDFVPTVTPYLAARIGYGVASTSDLPDPDQVKTFSSGAFLDLGAGVAWRLTRAFELGLEAGYSTIEPGGCFCARWVHAGAAGTFLF